MANTKLYQVLSGLYNTENKIFNRLSGHEADEMDHITSSESSYTSGDIGRVVRKDDELYLIKEGDVNYTIVIEQASGEGEFPFFGTYVQTNQKKNGSPIFKNENNYYIAKMNGSYSGDTVLIWALMSESQYEAMPIYPPEHDFDISMAGSQDQEVYYTLGTDDMLESSEGLFKITVTGNKESEEQKIIDDSEFSSIKSNIETFISNI